MVEIEIGLEEQEQSGASCDFLSRRGKYDPRFFMETIADDGWYRFSRMQEDSTVHMCYFKDACKLSRTWWVRKS